MSVRHYKSVWEALERGPKEAASLKARSAVMLAVRHVVDRWELTQTAAARRLGISQPRLNDLLKGRIDKFSLDALVDLAERAGLAVSVKVSKRAA